MDGSLQRPAGRLAYLDLLRIFATFSVILLHFSVQNWFTGAVGSGPWYCFTVYNSAVRWGVPVFVMISGALFLGREIPLRKLYTKYALRMLTAFLAWSLLYFFLGGDGPRARLLSLFRPGRTEQLASILRGPYHIWFVFLIAGLYLCVPLFRQLIQQEQTRRYYLLLSFLFASLLPQLGALIQSFGGERLRLLAQAAEEDLQYMHMDLVLGYGGYFVLGYTLSRAELTKKQRGLLYALGLLGFGLTALLTMGASLRAGRAVSDHFDYFRPGVLAEAAALFVLFRHLPAPPPRVRALAARLSRWSFGAYLVHALVIDWLGGLGLNTLSFAPWLSVPALSLLAFVLSYGISALLNRIPGVRTYLV